MSSAEQAYLAHVVASIHAQLDLLVAVSQLPPHEAEHIKSRLPPTASNAMVVAQPQQQPQRVVPPVPARLPAQQQAPAAGLPQVRALWDYAPATAGTFSLTRLKHRLMRPKMIWASRRAT
jgi:hypothetical protein